MAIPYNCLTLFLFVWKNKLNAKTNTQNGLKIQATDSYTQEYSQSQWIYNARNTLQLKIETQTIISTVCGKYVYTYMCFYKTHTKNIKHKSKHKMHTKGTNSENGGNSQSFVGFSDTSLSGGAIFGLILFFILLLLVLSFFFPMFSYCVVFAGFDVFVCKLLSITQQIRKKKKLFHKFAIYNTTHIQIHTNTHTHTHTHIYKTWVVNSWSQQVYVHIKLGIVTK